MQLVVVMKQNKNAENEVNIFLSSANIDVDSFNSTSFKDKLHNEC